MYVHLFHGVLDALDHCLSLLGVTRRHSTQQEFASSRMGDAVIVHWL